MRAADSRPDEVLSLTARAAATKRAGPPGGPGFSRTERSSAATMPDTRPEAVYERP